MDSIPIFTYKEFDLTLDFQGVGGVEIYNANLALVMVQKILPKMSIITAGMETAPPILILLYILQEDKTQDQILFMLKMEAISE